jgi:hypothetical protein
MSDFIVTLTPGVGFTKLLKQKISAQSHRNLTFSSSAQTLHKTVFIKKISSQTHKNLVSISSFSKIAIYVAQIIL